MTEKVKVTREQAEAIDEIKDIDYAINIHSFNKRPDSPLADMKTSELARALFAGYEVEPELKIGDFVEIGLFGVNKVAEVTGVKGDTIAINGSDEYYEFKINRVLTDEEKQEEKERRWWKKHGRDVWELRYNDTLICDKLPRIVDKIADLKEKTVIFTDGDWEYFDNVKEEYKVLVFAKDRLDVKTDD